jgi:hypothetical protein
MKAMKSVTLFLLIFIFFCILARVDGAENADSLVQKYLHCGLIPLTESPSSAEPDYRLWQDAYKALVAMDKDISGSPEWLEESKREAFAGSKIEQYHCNELIKQFNLGHYGNRFYSIFSGSHKDGFTLWNVRQWFLLNAANPRDIGPNRIHPGEMKLTMKGDRVLGEYHRENNQTFDFEGKLDNARIIFTMRMRGGSILESGELQVRTPLYLFGTWCDNPCGASRSHGEWDLRKKIEDR